MQNPRGEVSIAVVGKYVEYEDSYKSLKEALIHGAAAHRIEGRHPLDRSRGNRGAGLGAATRRIRWHPGARRLRQAGHRWHAQRHPLRARAQGSLFRHLPGDADAGDRIRAQRGGPGRRRFHGVQSGHAASRDFQAARIEGRGRTGRHHASGKLGLPLERRQLRAEGLRRARDSASGTATATNSIASTKSSCAPRACASPAKRPMARTSRSARSPDIRGSSGASSIPSSSRSPWSRTRFSRRSSARRTSNGCEAPAATEEAGEPQYSRAR